MWRAGGAAGAPRIREGGGVILITGGAGFIGAHVAREFSSAGASDLVLLDSHPGTVDGDQGAPVGRVPVESLDVCNLSELSEVVAMHKVESIVHLAMPARAGVPLHEEMRAALMGTLSVLEAANAQGLRRVTIASSVSVYEGVPEIPWREDVRLPMGSTSTIGALKKVVEICSAQYAQKTGVSLCLLRIGFVYGPGYHTMINAPSRIVHGAVAASTRGATVYHEKTVGNDEGADYCYVKDVARAITQVHLTPNLSEMTYNIGGRRVTSNREIADAAERAIPGLSIDLEGDPSRTGPGGGNFMDLSRLERDTGYRPAYGLDEGIREYVEWEKARVSGAG